MRVVQVDDEKVEAEPEFCYLRDYLMLVVVVNTLQIGVGQVSPTTPPPHQMHSATFGFFFFFFCFFVFLIQFYVPFKIISAHMRRANQ